MNNYIRNISAVLVGVLLSLLVAHRAKAQSIPDIKFPDLYPGQQIKKLVIIHANENTPGADMVLDNTSLVADWTPMGTTPSVKQLWFIVQDYNKDAFALVSAYDKSWLYLRDDGFPNVPFLAYVSATPHLNAEGADADNSYYHYFTFKLPRWNKVYNLGAQKKDSVVIAADYSTANTRKLYSIYLARDKNKFIYYSHTDSMLHAENAAGTTQAATRATFRLEPYVYPGGLSPFIVVPFQPSVYHTIGELSLSGGEKLTRISRNGTAGNKAKDVILSYHALASYRHDDTLLKIDLSGADNAYVGWLSYEKVNYSQNTLQNNAGNRAALPRFGIGVANNKVYAIREGYTDTLSNFQKNTAIIVSVTAGKMKLGQTINGAAISRIFYDVPVHSILSEGIGSKGGLIARLQIQDTILVGYKPGNWLFSTSTAGTQAPFITSTNPDLPLSPELSIPVNYFDWRARTYTLRYKSNGVAITEMVNSPFFTNYPEFAGISANYLASGEHSGGEDNNPYSGWELIKADLGYKNDGSEIVTNNLRTEPYLILYNRYQGRLRVFVYLNNNSIANNYKLTLSVTNLGMYGDNGTGANARYKPPYLWSSYLQGKALDNAGLTAPDYYKAQQLNSSSSGRFYYTDFQMNYDPCVAFFESAIQVKVDKLTQGAMSIVGRSLGGSIPTSAGINDWMARNGNFLTGALNSSYGSLSQTMGDLTFNNYRQWGVDSMKNYAKFTLPGKKVSPWEYEEARLKYHSESVKAFGTYTVATGTLLTAVGEAAGIIKIVDAGAPLKAAGKLTEATGKFIEASGTAMSAHANVIRLRNLKDQPDQNIPVAMPDPQPSLVYSDLALQGTLSIQSPVFSNVFFTTPGSKNAKYAPEFRPGAGAKGDFPFYNEPLGLYNLLTTPVAGLAVAGHQAQVALKEYPVVALNGRIAGITNLTPLMHLVVTTYDTSGVARNSAGTRAYVLTRSDANLDAYDRLPASYDVSQLVDWATIDSNIVKNGGSLTDLQYEGKLALWIKVQLVVGLDLFAGKSPDGNYIGSSTTMAFPATTSIKASRLGATTVETLLGQFNYTRVNNATFGANRIFDGNDTTNAIRTLMNTYCNSNQASQISTTANTLSGSLPFPGLPAAAINEGLKLYPNPAQDECHIAYIAKSKGDVVIELFDINGRSLVRHRDQAAEEGERKAATVHLDGLSPGIYAVKVRFSNNTYYTGKIVKR